MRSVIRSSRVRLELQKGNVLYVAVEHARGMEKEIQKGMRMMMIILEKGNILFEILCLEDL